VITVNIHLQNSLSHVLPLYYFYRNNLSVSPLGRRSGPRTACHLYWIQRTWRNREDLLLCFLGEPWSEGWLPHTTTDTVSDRLLWSPAVRHKSMRLLSRIYSILPLVPYADYSNPVLPSRSLQSSGRRASWRCNRIPNIWRSKQWESDCFPDMFRGKTRSWK